ncbi:MAG TPA: alpha/beta fold hydrolase [Xanthobacteraceae bacterium]|jgi:3-oxoadipate enol-lactonase
MTSTAKLRDGTRLVYDIHGRDDGRPRLVLIHSLGMDRLFWERVTPLLADSAATLTYDCRGHGASDKPKGPYRVEQFADDLAELMDQVGWQSAIVAGASMGGCITLAFAAHYPARATALGLIDTTAWYNAADKWEDRATAATGAGLKTMIEFQVTRWFTDGFRAQNPDLVKRNVDRFLANDPEAFAQTCRMLGACNLEADLPRMKMPAAIVVGDEDYATPVAMAETLCRGIAGSTLTILKGARHLTPLEAPQDVAAVLQRLLQLAPVR